MSKVIIVAHPETNELFSKTSNPNWVKCQLRQVGKISVVNGVISTKDASAFPLIQTKVANSLGLKDGDEFPIAGKIVRRLSRIEFYEQQSTVKVSSQDDAEDALIDGLPYYSDYQFTTNMKLDDVVYENWTEKVLEEQTV